MLPQGLLITENHVVDSVAQYLRDQGWKILQKLNTSQAGFDLIAEKSDERFYIEAKGGTSSKIESKKYGHPFTDSQAKDHLAMALWKIGETMTKYPDCKIGIALPKEHFYWKHFLSIKALIDTLDLIVFWVDEKGVNESSI